ncbi:glycosyltransferase family 39 protein [Pelotomaculum terephthalicicum JT]|uniref:glycosyltransferase family 39 protein n=1 Tax=Pelotomaculum TaxID=191373 RepID=UPI0009CDA011|nr:MULTISPECIES: glycosyltransferase family 39 protein [Pelotomaculum]MCG9969562.1 glycosyltransferase family 39 protein [Pelotomaculum terephthalicicum JT]OPX85222.1 MAG: hypothetical protein A4E54_02479 [Pelotomaculum sp. PtaB.Bin117]OPY62063.1 MAG: hypothetical protein A4E56_01615 [Pelotomaculum sp. PtaU1.Bin065]
MEFIGNIVKYTSLALVILSCILIIIRFLNELEFTSIIPPVLKNITRKIILERENFIDSEKSEAPKNIFIKFLLFVFASRILIFAVTYIIQMLLKKQFINLGTYLQMWFIQDTPHYINIAQNGYQNVGEERFYIVFYPLYPFLIKIFSFLFYDYLISGILVSCLFLAIACLYVYKLVLLEFGNEKLAEQAVLLLLIFPYSFFFGIIYTESLFLALSAMVFYYSRKKKWALAGILGILGALTKNQGLFLFVPIAIEICLSSSIINELKKHRYKSALKHLFTILPYSLLPFIGFAIYLLTNKLVTGNWFKFLEYQKIRWDNSMWLFADSIKKGFMCALSYDRIFSIGTFIPQVIFFFVAIILIIISIKKVPLSYIVFSLIVIIFSYSPTWLLSGPRYISSLVPIYIFLLLFTQKSRIIKHTTNIVCVLLLFLYSTTFINGGTY